VTPEGKRGSKTHPVDPEVHELYPQERRPAWARLSRDSRGDRAFERPFRRIQGRPILRGWPRGGRVYRTTTCLLARSCRKPRRPPKRLCSWMTRWRKRTPLWATFIRSMSGSGPMPRRSSGAQSSSTRGSRRRTTATGFCWRASAAANGRGKAISRRSSIPFRQSSTSTRDGTRS
jgi:hypothetical protein